MAKEQVSSILRALEILELSLIHISEPTRH